MKMPNLSQFLDYRTFLAAHAAEQKRRNPRWSYGSWARRLGLGGTATITRIIQGDRLPGPKLIDKLITYFDFSPMESEYFKDLVRMERTGSRGPDGLLARSADPRIQATNAVTDIEQKTFEAISNWYILVVRELTRLSNAKLTPEWISEHLFFGISTRQASHAIRILNELGLIKPDQSGKPMKTEATLRAASDHTAEALCRYYEDMLDNAKKSLRLKDRQTRVATALTLVLGSQQIQAAAAIIDEMRDRLAALAANSPGDRLYQMQVQLFPLTKSLD
jgi:uncharacterized protein (TIGR02147 family)